MGLAFDLIPAEVHLSCLVGTASSRSPALGRLLWPLTVHSGLARHTLASRPRGPPRSYTNRGTQWVFVTGRSFWIYSLIITWRWGREHKTAQAWPALWSFDLPTNGDDVPHFRPKTFSLKSVVPQFWPVFSGHEELCLEVLKRTDNASVGDTNHVLCVFCTK